MSNTNILQHIVEKDHNFDMLPKQYTNLDTNSFSMEWNLFDFQEQAIKNAISVLYLYYDKLSNCKDKLFEAYIKNGLNKETIDELSISEDNTHFDLLADYFTPEIEGNISVKNFINRMSLWMATGSGKTLVMIKLIEIVTRLMKKKLIPQKDILILAPTDKILNQIKEHIDKFNTKGDLKIIPYDLRQFEEIKNQGIDLFSDYQIKVFYYRADNISDENKEKLISYKSYYNNGNWYVFLDEAHKGDKKESIRQQYYKIFSKNGFLFNFSATFTDTLDKITTCYDLKLSNYINKGYGKHLKLANSTFSNFKKEEYDSDDRKKIILKSLILFAAIKKQREEINKINPEFYHEPLMTTLTSEVNTKNAELKIFFRELAQIANQEYDISVIEEIKRELKKELSNDPDFYYEDESLSENFIDEIGKVTSKDILKYVFNSDTPGTIEVTGIEGNEKELAFSLTTSDTPFACIVIGDISNWKNEELEGYFYSKNVFKKSFLDNIEGEDSNINILMGSRVFTEGWDTNRLNVINYINIGMSSESQKYILQSIGRGARIEPITHYRKRLKYIDNKVKNEDVKKIMYDNLQESLETLFVFSTNKDAVDNIIKELDKEKESEFKKINGFKKNKDIVNLNKPIPIYDDTNKRIDEPYFISQHDYQRLRKYINQNLKLIPVYTYNRVKFADILYTGILDYDNLESNPKFKLSIEDSNLSSLDLLTDISIHFNKKEKVLSGYKNEEGEIEHYKYIVTSLSDEDIDDIENKIRETLKAQEDYLKEKEKGTSSTALKYIKNDMEVEFEKKGKRITLSSKFLRHYYNPIIFSIEAEDYFKHIITVESEIDFLKALEEYLQLEDNVLDSYDWWSFSKLDEHIDNKIYIPYFDRKNNKYRKFIPDFIFWLRSNNPYTIIFVDPKGIEMPRNAGYKIEGYEKHIKDRNIKFNNYVVKTKLWYYYKEKPDVLKEKLEKYWTNDVKKIFEE